MEQKKTNNSPRFVVLDDQRGYGLLDEYLLAGANSGLLNWEMIVSERDPDADRSEAKEREDLFVVAEEGGLIYPPSNLVMDKQRIERPMSSEIDESNALGLKSSTLLIRYAQQCTPQNPLTVIVNNAFTPLADAYLHEPTVVRTIMVVLGSDANPDDDWSREIVVSKFTTLEFSLGNIKNRHALLDCPELTAADRMKSDYPMDVRFYHRLMRKIGNVQNWEDNEGLLGAISIVRPEVITGFQKKKDYLGSGDSAYLLGKVANGLDIDLMRRSFWDVIGSPLPDYGERLPNLNVNANRRFLETETGNPFFYLGDTAWEIFHRLDRNDTVKYLVDRHRKGFNVVQAVILAELNALEVPNTFGHKPFENADPASPMVVVGAYDYWDHVDYVIDKAETLKMYVGLLPTWGKYVCSGWRDGKVDGIFDERNARCYGRFVGNRFADRTNIIWVLGGDRAAPTRESQAIWDSMARGIQEGLTEKGKTAPLITYHPTAPQSSSEFFNDKEWLSFNAVQSGHKRETNNWELISRDYELKPTRPTLDMEPNYVQMNSWTDADARRAAYWAVLAGACGHTYGHNSVWQMWGPNAEERRAEVNYYWYDALSAPSSQQMGYLRSLMESRAFVTLRPDQSLLNFRECHTNEDETHIRAARGSGFLFVYSASGRAFVLDLRPMGGERLRAWWFDPRTGRAEMLAEFESAGSRLFDPPGEVHRENDWLLVVDDMERYQTPPGFRLMAVEEARVAGSVIRA